jgi:hypothetical protein
MLVKAGLITGVSWAFASLDHTAQTVVLVGAAITAVGIVWRSVIRPIVRAAEHVISAYGLVVELNKRVSNIEEKMGSIDQLVELARDESVKDVRDLLRRGEVPHPLIRDE